MSQTCTECHFHNPAGMRFCGNCGSKLVESGPKKIELVEAQSVYLDDVGVLVGADLKERFRLAGLESAGQRRNVTVLFADLCDSTGLAEKFDEEELYDVIQRFIHLLSEKVYQYEGMVDKITGDGLMALFGAPIAYENPAERAVRSAVDMQAGLDQLNQKLEAQYGARLKMRVGLNRGSVIVGSVGADLLIDYTAIGDTVNLARRLQESASPESIVVSESVYQATRAFFKYQPLPDLNLKGYSESKQGYRLQGVKSQPGLVRGLQGFQSPMIGRDSELQTLLSSLDGLEKLEGGQFAVLCGDAGFGKSRLTAEFKSKIDQHKIKVFEGQSLTYRKSVSYWIFLELIRDFLGVTPTTPIDELENRLTSTVTQNHGSDAEDMLPFLKHLFSMELSSQWDAHRLENLDSEQLHQQTFIAVRNLFLAEASKQPIVLILEDLHWADELSLELLAFLLDSIDNSPIMVLAITRPLWDSNFDQIINLGQQRLKDRYKFIQLQTLSSAQSELLLTGLLGQQNIPQEFQLQILKKAAGIPFYVEEILRMLIDDGVLFQENEQWVLSPGEDEELDVPNNLQDLILTRFDRLDLIQRGVLQSASVIGKQFNASLLKDIIDFGEDNHLTRVLASLVEKAFISPAPELGEDEYLFRHVLTSDAVYGTLLRKDKKRLHGIVAVTLEQVHAERLENQIEVLAGHYLRSDYLDKAFYYLILAGNKSARDYANSQARKQFEEAKELLPLVPHSTEQAIELWTGLGDVLVFIGEYEEARWCFQEALEVYKQALSFEDNYDQSALHRKIAVTFERQGDFDLALDQLACADEVLKAAQNFTPVPKAQILNDTGWIYFLRGNYDQAQDVLQSALNLVVDSDQFSVVASIHNRLGAVAYQIREYDQATLHVRRSLELRKTLGDLSGEARLYNNLGLLGLMSGDLREAETNFIQSIELLEKIGDTEGISLANINLGLVKFDRGDYESAEAHLEKAQAVAKQIGHRFYLGLADMYLGRLNTARGQYEHSIEMLDESMQIFEDLGAQDNLIDTMCYLAENHLAWGDLEGSIRWSEKAHHELADDNGDLLDGSVQLGRVLRLQGTIARHQGEYARAEKLLLESAKIFSAAYEKLESARTAYELGLLALTRTKYSEAQHFFLEARTIFDEVGADKELLRLDFAMSQIAA